MAKGAFMSMTPFKVTVDKKQLLKELTVSNQKQMGRALREEIKPKLKEKQEQLIKQFEIHPITIEIDAGPRASNSSGTLGGYGNLFSFIGFSSGSNPTDIIKKIFSEKIKFKVRRVNATGKYKITFYIPSIKEIYGLTPLPWAAGQSWVNGIEKGMSNLGSYLYSASGYGSSVSGTGLQSENKTSGVSFKNTPYVSRLLKNFKARLTRLNK